MNKPKTLNRRELAPMLLDGFLLVALACAAAYVLYVNFVKLNPFGLNSDIVNEISYRQASWEQKTFFPDGFWSSQESFATRPILIYWLFYGITGNFLLSYELEYAVTFLIELALVYLLTRRYIHVRSVRLLTLLLYVIHVKISSFMFWNAYIVFIFEVLVTLLLRDALSEGLRKAAERKDDKKQRRNIYIYIYMPDLRYRVPGRLRNDQNGALDLSPLVHRGRSKAAA